MHVHVCACGNMQASLPHPLLLRFAAAKVSEGVGGVGVANVAEVGFDERTQGAASDLGSEMVDQEGTIEAADFENRTL